MRLFVSGGTGWFGRALLRYWHNNPLPDFSATLLSRDPERFLRAHGDLVEGLDIELIQGDVSDAASMPRGGDFTHVIHAATDSVTTASPRRQFESGISGTRNVLDLAVRTGAKRVLFTSSGAVYGRATPGMERFAETYPGDVDMTDVRNAYAMAKRTGEHLCALYADEFGLEPVIARCFAFLGQDMAFDAHFAIGNFIADVARGDKVVLTGDGTPVRSYLDQRDLAHWLTELLLRGTANRIYNVGSDEGLSLAEVAAKVMEVAGIEGAPSILGTSGDGFRSTYVPDISRARDELGLMVSIPLDVSIRETLGSLAV